MRAKRNALMVLAGVTALGVAACGEDDPVGPGDPDAAINADVAMVAADATIEDVRALGDAQHGGGFMHERSGSRTVEFFDALGGEQLAYDPLTTAEIHISMEMSMEVERDGWSASVERTRELEISGLEGEEATRTVNGSGSEVVTRSRHADGEGFRNREMTGTRVMEDVVHAVPFAENPYPLSGTITRQMTVTVTTEQGTRTHTREVVITFNGTPFPDMTVDGEPYEVDLDARERERPFREAGPRGQGPGA